MALDADTVLEVQTGGNDDNGGGFVSSASGTDWSQQTSAKESQTDGACADHSGPTYTFTSAAASFSTDDVEGNLIHITDTGAGGHAITGWYEVKSVNSETSVELDRDPTDGTDETGIDYKLGGCLATPGGLGKILNDHGVDGMKAYIKSGTYTLTTASANVSGGTISTSNGLDVYIEGYGTTRGDLGAKPVLDASSYTGVSLWQLGVITGRGQGVNLKADGQDGSGNVGFNGDGYRATFYRCEALDCNTGFDTNAAPLECLAVSCTTGFDSWTAVDCEAKACGTGFNSTYVIGCLAHDCTTKGFGLSNNFLGVCCGAWNNTGDGFGNASAKDVTIQGCWSINNTGYGFNVDSAVILHNCATYNNSSGKRPVGQLFDDIGHQTLTGDPFKNSGSDDFRPDNVANEGALLRGNGGGVPSQINNVDIGPVQHGDFQPIIQRLRRVM